MSTSLLMMKKFGKKQKIGRILREAAKLAKQIPTLMLNYLNDQEVLVYLKQPRVSILAAVSFLYCTRDDLADYIMSVLLTGSTKSSKLRLQKGTIAHPSQHVQVPRQKGGCAEQMEGETNARNSSNNEG